MSAPSRPYRDKSSTGAGMKAPSGYRHFQQYTPEQMELFKQSMSNLGPDSYLARLAGGDQSLFEEMEAPAMRQFSALQGNMASRFSGMGSGARRSSGFQNEMGAAGSNFAQDLQAQRQALQRQAIMDLQGLSGELLERKPYGLVEKRQKQGNSWGSIIGGGVGALGGAFFGNPMLGAQLGMGIGSGFDRNASGGGGFGGLGGGGGFGKFGSFRNPFAKEDSLAAGYDQEFRMNPAAMGY